MAEKKLTALKAYFARIDEAAGMAEEVAFAAQKVGVPPEE
jgi:hypothetical protein